ncbi:DUF2452 domain-containing protein [Limnovirga soli]|nr:DUF2452 domain-containing protein [Limnovirga soli]
MVQAYNFLASWQLFPEKCNYEFEAAPKSGFYKIESIGNGTQLSISINWISLDNQAFYSQYVTIPDGNPHLFENNVLADVLVTTIVNASLISSQFIKDDKVVLEVQHSIEPNGYLKVTQKGFTPDHNAFTNVQLYHKQLSVLPYASSVGSVAIKPTEEGLIKHNALLAMEEQTNMHLDQIKQQIELLARQAQEIRKRKELSLMVYQSKLSFQPVIGQTYHLYEKHDNSYLLSLISPAEWGSNSPFKNFIASVKLLADHTWTEIA